MKISEIKNKDSQELHQLLAERRDKLREIKFSVASKQHKNFKDVSRIKKDIARILTVLKKQDLAKVA
ncbi:50S ribosomal protein L29 [Patescibacteria group bacterium]|nr:50S ribosomal protein L29 [Patescibacteria group bacterium]